MIIMKLVILILIFNWIMPHMIVNLLSLLPFLFMRRNLLMWRVIKLARRQRCFDRDQGVKPVTMVIMTVLWRWRLKAQDDDGHIISLILIAWDVYPLCILFCLVRRQHY